MKNKKQTAPKLNKTKRPESIDETRKTLSDYIKKNINLNSKELEDRIDYGFIKMHWNKDKDEK